MTAKRVWRDGEGRVVVGGGAVRPMEPLGLWRSMPVSALERLRWHAVLAVVGQERRVEALLERRGFVSAVPRRKFQRRANRYAKSMATFSAPIAPGYVLIGFQPQQLVGGLPPWGEVFDLTMVRGVIGLDDDGRAWRLRGKQVADFLWDNDGQDIRVLDEAPVAHRIAEGMTVRIQRGAFTSFEGPVVRIEGEIATVMVKLFGRENEMAIEVQALDPVQ